MIFDPGDSYFKYKLNTSLQTLVAIFDTLVEQLCAVSGGCDLDWWISC
jgi:hypothetical protein